MASHVKAKTYLKASSSSIAIAADRISRYCFTGLVVLMLISSFRGINSTTISHLITSTTSSWDQSSVGNQLAPPCDEIYVVREGETLHSISDKCGDPFIVERNPHIQDPDDVFPGLVIKIIPYNIN